MNRRRLFTLLITIPFIPIAIAATPPPTVKAPQADAPTRVLFVGNKYDYYGKIDREMAAFLQQVADETEKKFYQR